MVVMLAVGAAYLGYRGSWSIHENAQELISQHLVQSGRGTELETRIERESQELVDELVVILGLCSGLALVCAGFTVWTIHRSLQKLEWQSEELQQVSWHMLETHEKIARRFSHEMHDELGQTLTGLKGLLKRTSAAEFEGRRGECIVVVDEALESVRELSQLLRPVVLDDFGLDAALRWLSGRFMQRTGIEVTYEAYLQARLSEAMETQLFRIAQEALTNVARHSGASKATITLRDEGKEVRLTIEDAGKGMPKEKREGQQASLGMVGMRARARQIGGSLTVENRKSGGMRVEVIAPLVYVDEVTHEQNTNSVS